MIVYRRSLHPTVGHQLRADGAGPRAQPAAVEARRRQQLVQERVGSRRGAQRIAERAGQRQGREDTDDAAAAPVPGGLPGPENPRHLLLATADAGLAARGAVRARDGRAARRRQLLLQLPHLRRHAARSSLPAHSAAHVDQSMTSPKSSFDSLFQIRFVLP